MKIGNIECYGIIYKIINKTNNKVYIGQTIRGFNERYCYKGNNDIERVYRHHLSNKIYKKTSYNNHILNSIKKYGFGAFEVNKIFDVAFSKEELDIKERLWILIYNSTNNRYGYNNRDGGSNGKVLNETKRKSSITKLGFDIEIFTKDIIQTYIDNKNISQKEIANKFNVSEGVINRILKNNNIITRTFSETKMGKNIDEHKDKIIDMYLNKKINIKEISDFYNVDNNIICKRLDKWNIHKRTSSEVKIGFNIDKYKDEIIEMYNNYTPIEEIGRTFNVTYPCIKNILAKYNIPTKTFSEILIGFNINDYKDELIDMYLNKNMSMTEIAIHYSISTTFISSCLSNWKIHKERQYEKINIKANTVHILDINKNTIMIFDTVSKCAEWMVENNICKNIKNARTRIHDSSKYDKLYKNKYYFKKQESDNDYYEIRKKTFKPIICLDNLLIFRGIRECCERSENIFNIKMNESSLCRSLSKGKAYHNYKFKYIKDLTPQEYIKYDVENKLKKLENAS